MAFGQPNYAYGNPYTQPYYGSNNYSNIQNMPTQPAVPQQQPTLFGKIVDSYETAKQQEVPLGLSGIYPKADGTAVYIKQWLNNGTTVTNEYKLFEQTSVKDDALQTSDVADKLNEIYEYISRLDKKIDDIKPTPTPKKKKVEVEVDEDE